MTTICIKKQTATLAAPKVGCLHSSFELQSSPRNLACPLAARKLYSCSAGSASRLSQDLSIGGDFLGGKATTFRKHVAPPKSASARKAGKCRAVLSPPAERTAFATSTHKPVETETVTLTVITGTEGDAGMAGSAKVTFVSKTGARYPLKGQEIPGPFLNNSPKPPQSFELPKGFEVAGIIIENPKDNRLDIRVLAWLAKRFDVKIPIVNKNLLDLLTKLPGLKRLTDGDWYINQLELTGGSLGGKRQVFPVYGWVQEASVRAAFDGTAYLSQKTPPGLELWRRKTLVINQNAYNFQPYNDLSKPPNNDNYLSPDFRPTLDPYPQHVLAPRPSVHKEEAIIPKDETFGLSKSQTFKRGRVRGAINLLWSLFNNPSTGLRLVRDFVIAGGVAYAAAIAADTYITPEVKSVIGTFFDGYLPGRVERVVYYVAEQLPVGPTAGIVAGLATLLFFLKTGIPKLEYSSVEQYAQSCFGRKLRLGQFLLGYNPPWVYTVGKQDPTKAWNTDFMFGWQTVAGINPESITLVTSEEQITKGGTITEKDVQKLRGEVPTFDSDIKNKQIYMLDYSVLEEFMDKYNAGAGMKAGKHLYAPVVLLRQDDKKHSGVPVPIAIKLCKDRKDTAGNVIEEHEIITPNMDKSPNQWGWTLAKAIAASGNSGVHQLGQHWLRTHAVCETYAIAMRRQLSEVHPVFKLLIPHTRYTMDINNKARSSLINTDGVIEKNFAPGPDALQVSAAAYRGWRFQNENPVKDLEARGVLGEDTLPNYPYREHALELWAALRDFVREYLDLHYTGSDDGRKEIKDDYELQNFWADVKNAHSSLDSWLKIPANQPKDAAAGEGLVWPKLETKKDLTDILATMMWAGSCMHSVVNFGQYDYSGFVPNSPASIRGKFDYGKLKDGTYTESDFMGAMPTAVEMSTVMTVVEALVVHSSDELYLGQETMRDDGLYPPELSVNPWLTDEASRKVYSNFVDRINKTQKNLELKNERAEQEGTLPYYYLLPRMKPSTLEQNIPAQGVPNSVTI